MNTHPPSSSVSPSSPFFSRYQLEGKIGEGSFSSVYSGVCFNSGEKVAIKHLCKADLREEDYVNEIEVCHVLISHPHPSVVKIFEVFEDNNDIFVVMELLPGGNLSLFLSIHPNQEEKDIKRICFSILAAAEHLHSLGICHRDIKLENVLLDKHNCPKLVDFNLACFFSVFSPVLTSVSFTSTTVSSLSPIVTNISSLSTPSINSPPDFRSFSLPDPSMESSPVISSRAPILALQRRYCGSLNYSSPEILGQIPYRGPEVDVWSLGVLFYVLLFLKFPFDLSFSRPGEAFEWRHELSGADGEAGRARALQTRLLKEVWKIKANTPKRNNGHALSSKGSSLLKSFFVWEGDKRPSISVIKSHPWFDSLVKEEKQKAKEREKELGREKKWEKEEKPKEKKRIGGIFLSFLTRRTFASSNESNTSSTRDKFSEIISPRSRRRSVSVVTTQISTTGDDIRPRHRSEGAMNITNKNNEKSGK